jgi:hypothetical protein
MKEAANRGGPFLLGSDVAANSARQSLPTPFDYHTESAIGFIN